MQRCGWDKAHELYERHWACPLGPAQMRVVELADFAHGDRVLDVACGTGLVTFPAAVMVGSDGLVAGIDISGRMIEHVQREARRRGMLQVEANRMKAEALLFPENSFDVTLCAFGLNYVTDPATALQEMFRVTRPGGRMVAAVWGRRECCGWAGMLPIMKARVPTEVCDPVFDLGTDDALARAILAAGFADVTVERMRSTLAFDSEAHALAAVFAGGPGRGALLPFRRRHQTRGTRRVSHFHRLLQEGSRYLIPGEFVLAVGKKLHGP